MIIRINNKNGKNIAKCELWKDEYDNTLLRGSNNIKNVYSDLEQNEYGFEEVIDIDVDNLISPQYLNMIKSLATAWGIFEVTRTNYELDCSDDHSYASEIIQIPKTYGYIDEKIVTEYHNKLNDFLGWDGTYFNNDTYDYNELDTFIQNLNPIYKER